MNEGVSPPTITVGVNGKTASANLPSGGGLKGSTSTEYLTANNYTKFYQNFESIPDGNIVGISVMGYKEQTPSNIYRISFVGIKNGNTILGAGTIFYTQSNSTAVTYILKVEELETSVTALNGSLSFEEISQYAVIYSITNN